MRSKRVRGLFLGIMAVILGLSVIGALITRSIAADEERHILTERGAAIATLLQSVFQQELASMSTLGRIAEADPKVAQRAFAASARDILLPGTEAAGIAQRHGDGFVIRASLDKWARGRSVTGRLAGFLSEGFRSLSGAARVLPDDRLSDLMIAVPSGDLIVFLEMRVTPGALVPAALPPSRSIQAAVYAGPSPDATQLLVSTAGSSELRSDDAQIVHIQVGDDIWTLQYASTGRLAGALASDLPWLTLGAGLVLAAMVGGLYHALARRQAYARRQVQDKTESLAASNAQLAEAQEFLRHLVEAGPIVVSIVDAETFEVSYISPNASRLFDTDTADANLPGYIATVVEEPYLSALRAQVKVIADGPPDSYASMDFPVRVGGTERWVSAVLVTADGLGRPGKPVLTYVIDVDARHRAEQVQQEAKAAADAANRSKSEFLSRMSHELRTPLNAVLGYAQLFEMGTLLEGQRQPVQQILSSGRHLLDLINEVLDISRIEGGNLSLALEPVSPAEAIADTVDMLSPAADQAGIHIALRLDASDTAVLVDRQRLRQILVNLLSNAIKYNQRGGHVTITCCPTDDGLVRISVADDGPGISRDKFDMAFAPFERLGAQQTDVEGTGMGLALSRRIAEAMGTTIGLDSTVGVGSTFWIDLAAAGLECGGTTVPLPATGPVVAEPSDPSLRTVLLVEDNPTNTALIRRVLEHAGGVRLVSAASGEAGIAAAKEERPSLVFLDLHLPDISGREVLAALKEDPLTAQIPIIVVSADATSGQIDRVVAAGASAYLTKPIDVRELIELVRERTAGVA